MTPNDLIYISKIPQEVRNAFGNKVIAISNLLKANPNWFMQAFNAETAGQLKPNTRNTKFPFKKKDGTLDGYATGFIQFIPDTARRLGTTTWDLEKMSHVQQLDYVYKYFAPYAGKLKSYFDVYMVIFWPAGIHYSSQDNYIFQTSKISRSAVARANPAIDINKDGTIYMHEFKQYIKNTVPKTLWDKVFEPIAEHPVATGTGAFFFPDGLSSPDSQNTQKEEKRE